MKTAAIPPLLAVLDGAEFRAELDRRCISEWHWGTPEEVRVRPLRVHRRRCTLEIAVRTRHGPRWLIGKAYADDRSDVFHMMCAVSHAGFDGAAEFSIPQPLAYLPAWGVRLEEKVEGASVRDVIGTGRPADCTKAAARCGEWLGRFHRTAPKPEHGRDIAAKLAHNREATTRMSSLRDKAEAVLVRLEAAIPLAAAVPRCAGHGSYIPDHVILSGRRTVVIDLDEYDAADPGRDVAWFLVSLQRRAIQLLGSRRALDGAADAFLQAYSTWGPPGALANLPLYQALMYLGRARRDLQKGLRELAECMLDQAWHLMSH